jgi:hypothetical protein
MADESTISGFREGGFDFNALIGSVGSNLQQWGLQSLNRQVIADEGERPAVKTKSVINGDESFIDKAWGFITGNPLVIVVVIVGGYFVWKRFK